MLKVIFRVYDIQSNFITEPWFTPLYLMFTENNEIRNDEDWKTTALLSGSGEINQSDSTIYMYGVTVDWDKSGDYYQTTFIGSGEFDNGPNWSAADKWYLVPKTGTYRFKLTIDGDAYLRDENSSVPTGLIVYAQFEVKIKVNNDWIAARVYIDDSDGSDNGEFIFNNYVIDTDYIELQAGDKLSIHTYYNVRIHPTVLDVYWTYTADIDFTLTNQVSRYYGYGSNVKPSELLPDITVNEFLKMVFMHFAITPQFSQETNIVRLNIWKRQTTGIDMSYKLDPTTGEVEYLEAFNYEVQFKPDTSDKFAEEWYKRNDNETGNYKANNGSKVLQIIQSDFSNTVMQIPYRLDADRVKLPTMWSELPEGSILQSYTDATCPEWKTKYNYRIMVWSGIETGQYKFGYHVAGEGRTVADVDYYIFKPYTATVNIEFADRDGVTGLFNRLHKAYIERQNNGTILTIQGKSDLLYLTNIANCDATQNLTAPFYLNFNPYAGRWTVQKIVSDGIVSQYTLILNNE